MHLKKLLTMTLRSWKLRARISCISISKGVRLNSVGSVLKGCSCTFFSFTPCRSSFISCTHRRAWNANSERAGGGQTWLCSAPSQPFRLTQSRCFSASSSAVELSLSDSSDAIFFSICATKKTYVTDLNLCWYDAMSVTCLNFGVFCQYLRQTLSTVKKTCM